MSEVEGAGHWIQHAKIDEAVRPRPPMRRLPKAVRGDEPAANLLQPAMPTCTAPPAPSGRGGAVGQRRGRICGAFGD
jgi:hypothetical protein